MLKYLRVNIPPRLGVVVYLGMYVLWVFSLLILIRQYW